MTLADVLKGKDIPQAITESLALISVRHIDFDSRIREGWLVVHTDLAKEAQEIFEELYSRGFPIERMQPVHLYDWDDSRSMADNNTSAFNYRVMTDGARISHHAYGRAIDINPLVNPYCHSDGTIAPRGAVYDPAQPGAVTRDIADLFKSRGWVWGGDWSDPKDWQHFEKKI